MRWEFCLTQNNIKTVNLSMSEAAINFLYVSILCPPTVHFESDMLPRMYSLLLWLTFCWWALMSRHIWELICGFSGQGAAIGCILLIWAAWKTWSSFYWESLVYHSRGFPFSINMLHQSGLSVPSWWAHRKHCWKLVSCASLFKYRMRFFS